MLEIAKIIDQELQYLCLCKFMSYQCIVQKLGFESKFSECKIQNIMGSCDVKFPICLEGLTYSHRQFSNYEPKVGYPDICP